MKKIVHCLKIYSLWPEDKDSQQIPIEKKKPSGL